MIIAVIIILALWIVVLTFFVIRIRSHYLKLIKVGGSKNLEGILDNLLEKLSSNQKNVGILKSRIDTIEENSKVYIQKVGLLRFNPFSETGGDQSFVLALLDKNKNGLVISSLHSRTNTRWYAKEIKQGKSLDSELSKEEEKAINQASKI